MSITIGELLRCRKDLVPPARAKKKAHPAYRAWDLQLQAHVPGQFIVYVRINVDLPESFSTGLRYHPPQGAPSVLLRVNGDHGGHRNPDGTRFSSGAHVHAPTEAELAQRCQPGMWAEGPPFAALLPVHTLSLVDGWRELVTRTNIGDSPDVRRVIAKMSASVDQLEIGF
jgi:hypothetical protein